MSENREPVMVDMHRPTIVTLCGSTRFMEAFQRARRDETMAGRIVLTIGCDMRTDDDLFGAMSPAELRLAKARLDVLHFAKIDLCDEILVLSQDGYIGESTEREICYAMMRGKRVRWLEKKAETNWNAVAQGKTSIRRDQSQDEAGACRSEGTPPD